MFNYSDSSECLYGEGQGQTQKPTEGTSWGNLPEGGSLGIAPDWGSWGIPPEGGSRGLPQGISRKAEITCKTTISCGTSVGDFSVCGTHKFEYDSNSKTIMH